MPLPVKAWLSWAPGQELCSSHGFHLHLPRPPAMSQSPKDPPVSKHAHPPPGTGLAAYLLNKPSFSFPCQRHTYPVGLREVSSQTTSLAHQLLPPKVTSETQSKVGSLCENIILTLCSHETSDPESYLLVFYRIQNKLKRTAEHKIQATVLKVPYVAQACLMPRFPP